MDKVLVVFVLVCCSIASLASAQLTPGFYTSRCAADVEAIIARVVKQRFDRDRSITAALLRMHFHDCFVQGCDASILIDSTPSKSSEKDAGPNLTVRGYELIDDAKKAVEAACADTVSCADIITLATRDAVALAGGPKYKVPTGRRDGLTSNPNNVNLPGPDESVAQAFAPFRANGFTLDEMVTLLGAHTVGVAHCSFFQDRLSNFQGSGRPDPSMDRALAARLLRICGTTPSSRDPTVFLDQGQGSSFTVDNQFYNQTVFKCGILEIDQKLAVDGSTRPRVLSLASNGAAFQQSFANAMIKLSRTRVVVGSAGEIRKNCRAFNPKRRPGGLF